MTNPLNIIKRHVVPSYINAFYQLDPKVYIVFFIEYPGVEVSPPVPPTSTHPVKIDELNTRHQLTLNMTLEAVSNFNMGQEGVSFNFRINGISHHVYIPYEAVISVFCPDSPDYQQTFPIADMPLKVPGHPAVPLDPGAPEMKSSAPPDEFALKKVPTFLKRVK